jgi:thiol-disulfide isomerase/thioredoxin
MMRKILLALFYTALAQGANAADISPLLVGNMQGLIVHAAPSVLPEAALMDMADGPQDLAQYRGRWAVVNFWATWCAPCRAEMPSIGRLAAMRPDLAVVPIATGRNLVPQITRFVTEVGVENLPHLRDPKMALASQIGILGLPVTIIVDPQGREVARMIGDAEWDSAEALAVLDALTAPTQ